MGAFFRITSLRRALGEVERFQKQADARLSRKKAGKKIRFSPKDKKIHAALIRKNPALAECFVGGGDRLKAIQEALTSKVRKQARDEAGRVYHEIHFSEKKIPKARIVFLEEKLSLLQQLCPHRRPKEFGGACMWCMQQ